MSNVIAQNLGNATLAELAISKITPQGDVNGFKVHTSEAGLKYLRFIGQGGKSFDALISKNLQMAIANDESIEDENYIPFSMLEKLKLNCFEYEDNTTRMRVGITGGSAVDILHLIETGEFRSLASSSDVDTLLTHIAIAFGDRDAYIASLSRPVVIPVKESSAVVE